MKKHQLLDNQLCFPVYTLSRLLLQEYTPLLKPYNITYTQYLVLMLLWEEGSLKISDITKRLLLETSTITPVLNRLEKNGYISKKKSDSDTRTKMIALTESGKKLQKSLEHIPAIVCQKLQIDAQDGKQFKSMIEKYISNLQY